MATVVAPSIDEDIWEDVWDEERAWREEHPAKEQAPEPQTVVIFGATGDLTHRKLIPALYNLGCSQLLPDKFAVVGFGRSDLSDDDFRNGLRESVANAGIRVRDDMWDHFANHISYVRGRYDDESSYKRLAEKLDRIDKEAGTQ